MSLTSKHSTRETIWDQVENSVTTETISKVLYPNDGTDQGKELRLKQQFFFVSASLQDMIRSLKERGLAIEDFYQYYQVQLNDTHPSIAVAELMRLLMDDHHLNWDLAWSITSKSIAYTNHTLLPEALEKWSVSLFEKNFFPDTLRLFMKSIPDSSRSSECTTLETKRLFANCLSSMKQVVDMSEWPNLATVGSHHINGVAALHSESDH